MATSTPHRALPALLLCLGVLASLLAAVPAQAVEDVAPARVEGPERTATAAAIARQAFPQGTDRAVLTTADAAQDALTAASLAGALNAAMLLVRADSIPESTSTALADLGVQTITLVGNDQSISRDVQRTLGEDYRVLRVDGADQYETAIEVSRETFAVADLPLVDGLRTVLLASGENFPDALAGSPAAFAGPTPVLFTMPDQLPTAVEGFFADVDAEQIVILGGPAAVSEDIATRIRTAGRQVVRLGGADRVETSTIVAAWTTANFDFAEDSIMLARGDNFPDALTAGQLAGRFGRPVVLSATPTVLPLPARQYFADRCEVIEVVQAVGGTSAISTSVLATAEFNAESCTTDIPGGTGTPPPSGEGDDALPDFTVTPLLLQTDPGKVDTIVVTNLGSATTLDVSMFSCDAVQVDDDGSALFPSANAQGFAVGYGVTQTGTSLVTGINNVDVEDRPVVPDVQAEDGRLGVQVSAFDPDCAVVVVTPAQPAGSKGVPLSGGRPTVPYGVSETRFGEVPEGGSSANHVYRVDPQEPQTGAIGTAQEFIVEGRFDGGRIGVPLDVVLFPCNANNITGTGPDVFNDTDNDGGADGFGATDTGAIMVTAINGQAITPDTVVGNAAPRSDGTISVEVRSDTVADCATVVIVAGNGNGKFDVNADGVPTENYGVGQVSYQ